MKMYGSNIQLRMCRNYIITQSLVLLVLVMYTANGQISHSRDSVGNDLKLDRANKTDLSTDASSPTESPNDTAAPNTTDVCQAFYNDYVKAAGDFLRCELNHATPFRLCSKCIEAYAVVREVYSDLNEKKSLEECKNKYTRSDRVQIIPQIQQGIEDMWTNADCQDCSTDIHINHTTKEVNYTVPADISKFMELYKNLSDCLNKSLELNFKDGWLGSLGSGADNVSSLCHTCAQSYQRLNEHYIKVSNSKSGDVCMDMVDMMNHTRLIWSRNLNCTYRSGDSMPVIVIACVVASTPAFFYGILKITGKVHMKKTVKQKRLGSSHDSASMSQSVGRAAGNARRRLRQRLTQFT